ncbi:MAG TPA: VanW family protein [Beijerinckiaceae bacterium]|jgi:vancomycin resistance protein VanW
MASAVHRHVPSRLDVAVFGAKATAFRALRTLKEVLAWREAARRHAPADALRDAPVVARVRSPLWSGPAGAREYALTAGKIQNLRLALAGIDGVVVPAGEAFSFWKQVGRASRWRGFVEGRELREGCLVRSVGGGLCQLSNALYEAALAAGFEIVERHAHSRMVPGSRAALGRDATVFWNYVDLRFRSRKAFRIEARLTSRHLEVLFRAEPGAAERAAPGPEADGRAAANDCTTCGEIRCHLNDPEIGTVARRPTAWLVDGSSPEFSGLLAREATRDDALFLPMRRPARARYAWPEGRCGTEATAAVTALRRAFALRRAPAQGRALQSRLLAFDAALAGAYARKLSHLHTRAVVAQNLLPHLWIMGALAGRSFDVLVDRWPMAELQRRLDGALAAHPESPTLGDFRAPPDLVAAEAEALAAAEKLYTPHRAIAAFLGGRAVVLDWAMPAVTKPVARGGRTVLFPASALGRKGAYELREAMRGLDAELLVAGGAKEHDGDFWAGLPVRPPGGAAPPEKLAAVVLPATIEHQPRALLRALAAGIPVIATQACGLGERPGVVTVPELDAAALRRALERVLAAA